MFRFYETPDVLVSEQDQFERDIHDFQLGQINPVKFKAIRVAHGIYEQRQNDTYMVRIRCAAGGITPDQLRKVAKLASEFGNGEVHFTTRQEVQIHDVLIENVMTIIRQLYTVGLSTRGGGGNTIRNILTSVDSGISLDEVFDVDPYAMALTTRLIQEPDSWNLPRKFKIAFSHNEKDTSYVQATCLGYVATIKDGQRGFQVYVCGGMGAKPMVGSLLLPFIPDTQVYHVAKAIKVVFDKHGNRRSKHSSRIKFLWKKVGEEEFKKLFEEEYSKIKEDSSLNLELPEVKNESQETTLSVEAVSSEAFETWKSRFVFDQKQPGLKSIKIALRLGDLLEEDADGLCSFLSHFGDNTIRCDRGQNIRLRNIPERYLGNLFLVVERMKQSLHRYPYFVSNMVNCTGASTCKLGICLPRGLSDAIRDYLLEKNDLDLDKIPEFRLNMSGCPNTCGLHHIADLGFFGKIGRKEGELFPSYYVLAGAKVGNVGHLEYAQKEGDLPAKEVPPFVHAFLKDYIAHKGQFENYHAYLDARGRELIKTYCAEHQEIPLKSEAPEYYTDFGAKKPFSLEDMGSAECSAGMFDMIDVDKKTIGELRKQLESGEGNPEDFLYGILFATSRMLLVTRGLDPRTDDQVLDYFGKHFVETHLVNPRFAPVVALGKSEERKDLLPHKMVVLELSDAVLDLYKNMDDSLRFKKEGNEEVIKTDPTIGGLTGKADVFKDFRGVGCPMNFVKTKLALARMSFGQTLEIWLDDGEPIENVPGSILQDGHEILEKRQTEDGYWLILMVKK